MSNKSNTKNGQQYQKWLFALSEILCKIGIGFISSFTFNNFKLTFEGWNRPVCHLFGFVPRTVKRIVTALMPSLLFRCFSLFLLHLRTLAQEKVGNCLRFWTGGWSLYFYPLWSRNIWIFFPTLTMAARAKKTFLAKWFAHAIGEHYRDLEHAYVYWIWLRGSASYVIMAHIPWWLSQWKLSNCIIQWFNTC